MNDWYIVSHWDEHKLNFVHSTEDQSLANGIVKSKVLNCPSEHIIFLEQCEPFRRCREILEQRGTYTGNRERNLYEQILDENFMDGFKE